MLHQLLIGESYVLPSLFEHYEELPRKLTNERRYWASIDDMRFRLPKLEAEDPTARKIREQSLREREEVIEAVLPRGDFLYVLEIMRTKLINKHHNDSLTCDFRIYKTRSLIGQKYY